MSKTSSAYGINCINAGVDSAIRGSVKIISRFLQIIGSLLQVGEYSESLLGF